MFHPTTRLHICTFTHVHICAFAHFTRVSMILESGTYTVCVLRRCNRHHHHHHHHHPGQCVFCEGARVEARPKAGGQLDCLHLVSQQHYCHCCSPSQLYSLLMLKQLLHLQNAYMAIFGQNQKKFFGPTYSSFKRKSPFQSNTTPRYKQQLLHIFRKREKPSRQSVKDN